MSIAIVPISWCFHLWLRAIYYLLCFMEHHSMVPLPLLSLPATLLYVQDPAVAGLLAGILSLRGAEAFLCIHSIALCINATLLMP